MNHLLDDVRRDAIEKLRLTKDADFRLLLDTVFRILSLQKSVRRDGLLMIESSLQDIRSEFLKHPFLLIEDAVDPEDIIEITTNEYWITNPQGSHAMIAYICIRGALYIQSGKDINGLQELLRSLLPPMQRQEYQERLNADEIRRQRQVAEKFALITPPAFQENETLRKIDILEKELQSLPEQSLQELIRSLESDALAGCVFSLHTEVREKIMCNMSKRYAYIIMELVIDKAKSCQPLSNRHEKYISENISEVLAVITKLHDTY